MKVTEPLVWARAAASTTSGRSRPAPPWTSSPAHLPSSCPTLRARPVQTITGASVSDRRNTGDVKVTRRLGDCALSVSHAVSHENDYHSQRLRRSKASCDLTEAHHADRGLRRSRTTAWAPRSIPPSTRRGYTKRVPRRRDPGALTARGGAEHDRGRPRDVAGTTIRTSSRSRSIPRADVPAFACRTRGPTIATPLAWLTRYRRHFPAPGGTLQAEYRYYRDDWGIRAHTLEVGWQQALGERWAVRPALRYYTQIGRGFLFAGRPAPAAAAAIQRPAPRAHSAGCRRRCGAILRLDDGLVVEGDRGLRARRRGAAPGGGGSPAFATLRAVLRHARRLAARSEAAHGSAPLSPSARWPRTNEVQVHARDAALAAAAAARAIEEVRAHRGEVLPLSRRQRRLAHQRSVGRRRRSRSTRRPRSCSPSPTRASARARPLRRDLGRAAPRVGLRRLGAPFPRRRARGVAAARRMASRGDGRRRRVRLPLAGMELDFGGFGKEYAVDRAATRAAARRAPRARS